MYISNQACQLFLETLWEYYGRHGRSELPWRQPSADGSFDPYRVMVSELMLQQTQVARVIPKFTEFLTAFPTVHALARAELGDVLRVWQGLGYNRRAKYLWQAAQMVGSGEFPQSMEALVRLPGVGRNTAGAILTYAYNMPVAYVETNVRTVYIHHFFADHEGVADTDILALVDTTLDRDQPREFYWALMDYGTHLKATVGNLNKASKHYAKQTQFHGSRRQVRGAIIRVLNERPVTLLVLKTHIADERLESVLKDLVGEGMVQHRAGTYRL